VRVSIFGLRTVRAIAPSTSLYFCRTYGRLSIQKIGVEMIRKFDAGSVGDFRISNIADLGTVTLQRLAVALHPVKRL
jgi:hypothetical protein